MGEVYKARDTKLAREVAIKILPELFVADPERIARFTREARLLASLNHPHIGAIYGIEDAAGIQALVLEFVEGEPLRYCGFEHWLEAAAWLGRLRGHFAGKQDRLGTCGFLMRHDADFFVHAAERALRALSGLSEALAHRLAGVLEGYDPIVAVLTSEADTLVHGSYRPQNVLVVRSSEQPRICPTDWELAAFGSSAYDLAFVCDGFQPPRLDALLDAYEHQATSYGLPARDRDELRHEIDCFRLHKAINSLGHVRQWERPAETAAKVVDTAEEIAATLV